MSLWDETLYRGSAPHYVSGRLPYPPALADALWAELGLDGSGRLLDVGCGPGSLTLLLAPLFAEVVGADADADMLATAAREAARRGITTASWVRARAEELPASLGTFRAATFAQSFHWMDRPRVARVVGALLVPGGAWVHVHATTHQGVETDDPLPAPAPPREEIAALVRVYLGPVRRSGRGTLPEGTPGGEDAVMVAAGFRGPVRVHVRRGELYRRSEDDVVASVFSLSSAAPHLFGGRLAAFEADLRALLHSHSPAGCFCEKARDIDVSVWRRPSYG